jgi:hypothetical protein
MSAATQGSVSGQVVVPTGAFLTEKQVLFKLPIVHALLPVLADQTPATSFDYSIPVPPSPDWSLCVEGVGSPGVLITRICGLAMGSASAPVSVHASPTLLSPSTSANVMHDTHFTFTAFDGGIQVLELESSPSTPAAPSIYVFTAATDVPWPDLRPFGVPFPSGTSYRCTVGGVGPFSTMDDAFGPDGWGATTASETRASFAPSIDVTTTGS